MVHFQVLEWSAFVNRAAPRSPQTALQKHRETRRNRFAETDSLWQKAATAPTVEPSDRPSLETVRVVKAAFATAGFPAARQETAGPVQLLYDSFSQPPLPGTRSASIGIRQMLYRADPYQIDLHIELQREHNRFVIIGQFVDLTRPEMVAREVQVRLSNGREDVVYTVTNQFGEFRGAVKNSGDLEISFFGSGGTPIAILLREALGPPSAAKE